MSAGFGIKAGILGIGVISAIVSYLPDLNYAVSALGGLSANFRETYLLLVNLFDYLEGDCPHYDGTEKYSQPFEGEIRVRNLSFSYPGSDREVLKDVSLTIKKGEQVAFVGENGAGKSTIIRLMTGLNKADAGQVLIGGTDINELDESEFRGRISMVAQDFSRYYLTLRENVGLSDYQKMWDDEALDAAAEQGEATAEIHSFKEGWNQKVGTQYKDGIELSGGQWQKLALSRAYFKMRNIPLWGDLLIMDEPTAALDAYNEEKVYHRFLELSGGCTSVFVSHRLAAARLADRILVVKEGRVIETGSHEELMTLNRYYAELYRNQASMYQ